ncbi:MAG: hypothetical protein DWI00_13755 [Planctomycetota bacterium]|nr:MAG: hypothetical protein DWI00_13755 [Planctomycetota bacterium]
MRSDLKTPLFRQNVQRTSIATITMMVRLVKNANPVPVNQQQALPFLNSALRCRGRQRSVPGKVRSKPAHGQIVKTYRHLPNAFTDAGIA